MTQHAETQVDAQPPQWVKNSPDLEVYDGDVFICALQVKNNKTGKTVWEIEKLRVSCDFDGETGWTELHYTEGDCDPYDAWTFDDFEYVMKAHE